MTTTTADRPGAASAASPVTMLRVGVLVALMAVAAVAGEALRPTNRLSETKTPIVLERQVPEAFGEWRLDTSIRPVLPDPGLQAMLDTLYSQTLARTYVNAKGERVMLSIAYGSDQSNEGHGGAPAGVLLFGARLPRQGGGQGSHRHRRHQGARGAGAGAAGPAQRAHHLLGDAGRGRHLARLGPQVAADQVRPAGADS
ncbi:MAG: exosortase-associated EpsI family protein [Betaproteobacteria bacterium]|nr:exosortase-associated EpsI family protein [Betaproteobacteria bacterium]